MDQEMCEISEAMTPKKKNVTTKLENRKAELENELKQVNATLEILGKHPDVSTVLNSLSELRIRL